MSEEKEVGGKRGVEKGEIQKISRWFEKSRRKGCEGGANIGKDPTGGIVEREDLRVFGPAPVIYRKTENGGGENHKRKT